MKRTASVSPRTLAKGGIQIHLAIGAATVICALLCAKEVSAQPTVPGRLERLAVPGCSQRVGEAEMRANSRRPICRTEPIG